MVKNLGWFKKMIITKNWIGDYIITLNRLISSCQIIVVHYWRGTTTSIQWKSRLDQRPLTQFRSILTFWNNFLGSLCSKGQLQCLGCYLMTTSRRNENRGLLTKFFLLFMAEIGQWMIKQIFHDLSDPNNYYKWRENSKNAKYRGPVTI